VVPLDQIKVVNNATLANATNPYPANSLQLFMGLILASQGQSRNAGDWVRGNTNCRLG
jgi:hypothetical protein